MKIIDENNAKEVEDALYTSVAIACILNDAAKDDLLFTELDSRKDIRARAYNEVLGIHGFFNAKTLQFADKEFANSKNKRKSVLLLLAEYLKVASQQDMHLEFKPCQKEFQLNCFELKLNKEGKKILGKDLYLKVALLPKEFIFETNSVKDNDYYFLIDFHD